MRIGRISRLFSPGFSWCGRCLTTWRFVDEHTTGYCRGAGSHVLQAAECPVMMLKYYPETGNAGRLESFYCTGMFPLCEQCWQELTTEERLPYYEELWSQWSDPKCDFGVIREAVLEGR